MLKAIDYSERLDYQIGILWDNISARCFPYVVNISVKYGLTALTKVDLSDPTPAKDCFGISSSGDPEGETGPNLDKWDLDLIPESNIFQKAIWHTLRHFKTTLSSVHKSLSVSAAHLDSAVRS